MNAAIRGLFRAGATEVVLTNAHGSGNPEPVSYRNMVEAIQDMEGGLEILKKAQAKSPVLWNVNFFPTGEKIDFSLAYARGKHGYK